MTSGASHSSEGGRASEPTEPTEQDDRPGQEPSCARGPCMARLPAFVSQSGAGTRPLGSRTRDLGRSAAHGGADGEDRAGGRPPRPGNTLPANVPGTCQRAAISGRRARRSSRTHASQGSFPLHVHVESPKPAPLRFAPCASGVLASSSPSASWSRGPICARRVRSVPRRPAYPGRRPLHGVLRTARHGDGAQRVGRLYSGPCTRGIDPFFLASSGLTTIDSVVHSR
ncbi:hypothetical protein C8Q79DRAFT_231850 [Trametes meyenii]|nr:hypothetical protein C8Q79DRAFT_231850 [Trametes meyenii]